MKINLSNKTKHEIMEGFIEVCKIGSSKDCRIFVQEANRKGISYSELCEYKNNKTK